MNRSWHNEVLFSCRRIGQAFGEKIIALIEPNPGLLRDLQRYEMHANCFALLYTIFELLLRSITKRTYCKDGEEMRIPSVSKFQTHEV